ncbi:GNAT family N-acetyltransferase [Sphaerisporangium dianthi]|uniref:GNAT family N-acetyltransferase n=1 Tax=Sphaerisporangium dianthi TaxID=1436120 RepID=A0ABV9CSS0_9ACTN
MSATPGYRPSSPGRPSGRPGVARTRVRLVGASQATAYRAVLADVGGRVFTEPPWHEPYGFARTVAVRMLIDRHQPGFVLALALESEGEGEGGQVCGFAYGHLASRLAAWAGQPGTDDFTLKEMAVLPEMRGRGTGAALHDALLTAARGGPRWLATHPAATAALDLYRKRGWRTVAYRPERAMTPLIMRKAHG